MKLEQSFSYFFFLHEFCNFRSFTTVMIGFVGRTVIAINLYFLVFLPLIAMLLFTIVSTHFLGCTLFAVTGLDGSFPLYLMHEIYDLCDWFSRLLYRFSWVLTWNLTWFLTSVMLPSVMTVTTSCTGCAFLDQGGIYNAKYSYYFQSLATAHTGYAFCYLLAA